MTGESIGAYEREKESKALASCRHRHCRRRRLCRRICCGLENREESGNSKAEPSRANREWYYVVSCRAVLYRIVPYRTVLYCTVCLRVNATINASRLCLIAAN